MEISAFLNKEEPNMKLSEYEIVVKSVCNLTKEELLRH